MAVEARDIPPQIWRPSIGLIALAAAVLVISVVPFRDGLSVMWSWWLDRPEYSHGVLMPLLACFLFWQQRDRFERYPISGSWWGVALTLAGGGVLLLGKLASVQSLVQYAYVVTLGGLTLSLFGVRLAALLFVPFVILILMIPLPEFMFQNLTAGLQLLSSKIGVAFIRLCGVSVFLEGNVIDLGSYKLEVAEACSGLRYLFPLMTLGFIMAYFYRTAFWKRAAIFFSSIPVTILMNSLRIGVIGVMVDRWGQSMAEGFLHDFEGWLIFMASAVVLLLEIILLSRIGGDKQSWREVFGFKFPEPPPSHLPRARWRPTIPFVASCAVVGVLAVASFWAPERTEIIPSRMVLAGFPSQIDGWSGRRGSIERVYLDQLKLDDYIMSDYQRGGGLPVNFYVAWYDSQRTGQSAHSPRTCIPGGGWRIDSLDQTELSDIQVAGKPLRVNRAVIVNGEQRQVVYYWFQQRGRVITNEYLVKWYLFWDSLTRRRSDGSLVRLVVPARDDRSLESADAALRDFARAVVPKLDAYIPN